MTIPKESMSDFLTKIAHGELGGFSQVKIETFGNMIISEQLCRTLKTGIAGNDFRNLVSCNIVTRRWIYV